MYTQHARGSPGWAGQQVVQSRVWELYERLLPRVNRTICLVLPVTLWYNRVSGLRRSGGQEGAARALLPGEVGMRGLWLVVVLFCLSAVPGFCTDIAFVGPDGGVFALSRDVQTFQQAAEALVKGPTYAERASGISTAIPDSTQVSSVSVSASHAVLDLTGPAFQSPLGDAQVDTILEQCAWTARAFGLSVTVLINGKPSDTVRFKETLPAAGSRPVVQTASVNLAGGALLGKKITLSPGHGLYWTGSYYTTQRGITCTDLIQEDYRNLEHALYLEEYLKADGAIVYRTREHDKNRGNHPLSNQPWWKMAAPYYLWDKGYPLSVCSAITGRYPGDPTYTSTQVDDDRRSRPEASNLDQTDMYLALHTNAFSGGCYGSSCPTGVDIYADSTQLGGFFDQSLNLAGKILTQVNTAVRATYQANYPTRNGGSPHTDQAFTEIHYPRRPACLLEFGFHDSCDTDGVALRDPVFRSSGMWGEYAGVCQYYGVTPTWGLRSYEIISSDLPDLVKGGSKWTAHFTIRNHGCVWNSAHQFRLGALGGSDPFSTTIRFGLPGEIGPGQDCSFSVPLTAPTTDGTYTTHWAMVQDERNTWFGSPIYRAIKVDCTPPTSPAPVLDGGPYQTATDAINASWQTSTDAKAGLDHYEYRVTDGAGNELKPWTSNGVATSVVIPLSLTKGVKYLVWVKAVDKLGWETTPVSSQGVVVTPDTVSIAEAKAQPDGSYVKLAQKVVTGVFADHFYVQETNRASGIRVDGALSVTPGSLVDVTGKMWLDSGERQLVEAAVSDPLGTPGVPVPLSVSGVSLGGGAFNAFTPGVEGGYGLSNLGLLVRVYGKVSGKTSTGFRLDDGSVPSAAGAAPGVWVVSGTFHQPDEGAFSTVIGVSSVREGTGERQVGVFRDQDIQP